MLTAHLCTSVATIIRNLSNRKMTRYTIGLLGGIIVEKTYTYKCFMVKKTELKNLVPIDANIYRAIKEITDKRQNSIPLLSRLDVFLNSARSFSSSVTMES